MYSFCELLGCFASVLGGSPLSTEVTLEAGTGIEGFQETNPGKPQAVQGLQVQRFQPTGIDVCEGAATRNGCRSTRPADDEHWPGGLNFPKLIMSAVLHCHPNTFVSSPQIAEIIIGQTESSVENVQNALRCSSPWPGLTVQQRERRDWPSKAARGPSTALDTER